jgi:flagellar hook-length control protein FliK
MTLSLATAATAVTRGRASMPTDGAPKPAQATDVAATADGATPADSNGNALPATDGRIDFQALLLRGAANVDAQVDRADATDEKSGAADRDTKHADAEATGTDGDGKADATATTAAALAQAVLALPALAMPMAMPAVTTWRMASGDAAAAGASRTIDPSRAAASPLPAFVEGDATVPKAPVSAAPAKPASGDDAAVATSDASAATPAVQPRVRATGIEGQAGTSAQADTDSRTSAPASAPTAQPAPLAQAFAAAMPAAQAQGAPLVALRGTDPAQWRDTLRDALGDRLQVQVADHSERAVIRLDPPALGRIEIVIRHEAGNLQVHLSASNGDVLRQLHTIGDSLRQDLVHRQYGEVAVTVSDARGEGGGQRREREAGAEADTPGRALGDAEGKADSGSFAFLQDRE